MAGHLVGHRGHICDARCVDPVVVELEQRTDSDRVVERFVRPTGFAHAVDICLTDGCRIRDHLFDERVERSILFRKQRRLDVVQYALDERLIS